MKLSDVPIADPCHADWDSMDAKGARRFCEQCDKHVHDLSSMTRPEAAALVASRGSDRLCVRYRVAADGTIRFQSRAPNLVPAASLARGRAGRVAGLGSAAALSLAMAACTPHGPGETPPPKENASAVEGGEFIQGRLESPPPDRELMGDIAMPEPEPDPDHELMGELVAEPDPEQVVKGELAPPDEVEPCEKPAADPEAELGLNPAAAKSDVVKMGKVAPD